MRPWSLFVTLFIAISLASCTPYRPNQIEAIRTIAYQDVDRYAEEIGEYELRYGKQKTIDIALLAARNQLKDPDSAKFRNVRLVSYAKGMVVCGEVNAKNSYGGYVGFAPFVAGTSKATLHEPSGPNHSISEAHNAGIVDACSGF